MYLVAYIDVQGKNNYNKYQPVSQSAVPVSDCDMFAIMPIPKVQAMAINNTRNYEVPWQQLTMTNLTLFFWKTLQFAKLDYG